MVPYNPVLLQRHARQHDSNILNSSQATPGVAGCHTNIGTSKMIKGHQNGFKFRCNTWKILEHNDSIWDSSEVQVLKSPHVLDPHGSPVAL